MPALKVGDDVIIDSVAICQYLADAHEKLTASAGTITRAQQDSWTQFAMDDVETPLWIYSKHAFVLPEDLRSEAAQKACQYDFENAMTSFAARLGDQKYVMGDTFTVPDLLLGHCGKWAQNGPGWSLPAGPVADYFARAVDRPAYQRADEIRARYS